MLRRHPRHVALAALCGGLLLAGHSAVATVGGLVRGCRGGHVGAPGAVRAGAGAGLAAPGRAPGRVRAARGDRPLRRRAADRIGSGAARARGEARAGVVRHGRRESACGPFGRAHPYALARRPAAWCRCASAALRRAAPDDRRRGGGGRAARAAERRGGAVGLRGLSAPGRCARGAPRRAPPAHGAPAGRPRRARSTPSGGAPNRASARSRRRAGCARAGDGAGRRRGHPGADGGGFQALRARAPAGRQRSERHAAGACSRGRCSARAASRADRGCGRWSRWSRCTCRSPAPARRSCARVRWASPGRSRRSRAARHRAGTGC